MPSVTEPLFWTPDAIKQLAATTHAAMLAFQGDMSAAKDAGLVQARDLAAWRTLRDAWSRWYGAAGVSTWLWSANVSTIEDFGEQLNVFRTRYRQWTGRDPSGAGPTTVRGLQITVDATQPVKDTFQATASSALTALAAAGALGLVGYWAWRRAAR